MKFELNKDKLLILGLSAIFTFLFLLFLPREETSTSKASIPSTKDINAIVKKTEEDNKDLKKIYETEDIKEFISLVYETEQGFKNIIIDTYTGKYLEFTDLIKENKIKDYEEKELELLSLKYPSFIVEGIKENKGSTGYKNYYVKDNEVIIFYYDYVYELRVDFNISLTINYNEIKDYLSFKPSLDTTYTNEDGYKYSKDKKTVSLTFDDGPSGKYNSLILEELNKNKAHATFFMVGRMMNSCQKCVIDTYKSGNEVGSHTYNHINIKKSKTDVVDESLEKVNSLYTSLTGDKIKYLRPPYGAYNKNNLDNATMPFVLWNLDTEDWRYRDVDHIVNYILDNVKDGAIILMHELYETSYEALKIVLPKLYAMGYQVVNVSELANIKGRTLEMGRAYRSIS